jgi:cytochrome c-type biogenesis protein CcmE
MNPKRKKRLALVLLVVLGVGTAVALALNAFQENLLFFYSPRDVVAGKVPDDHAFRIGGLVTAGSVKRQPDGLTVQFDVTDMDETVAVRYTGILPDLFREGQGIVALGRLGPNGVFVAEEVLAKHDENYMPPEVAEALGNAHEEATGTPVPEPNSRQGS